MVGQTASANPKTAIFRLDRGRLRRFPTPSDRGAGALNQLEAVTAPAVNDAWAVGNTPDILHWNGTRWRRTAAPHGSYWSVSASARDDVWAVGTTDTDELLVSHWNGSTWTRIPFLRNPIPPSQRNGVLFQRLTAVLALAKDDVWVVGDTGGPPIDARWDGHRWHSYAIPDGKFAHLNSLAAVSSTDVWAAGFDGKQLEWTQGHWHVRSIGSRVADPIGARRGTLWGIGGATRTLATWNGSNWVSAEPVSGRKIVTLALGQRDSIWALADARSRGAGARYAIVGFSCKH